MARYLSRAELSCIAGKYIEMYARKLDVQARGLSNAITDTALSIPTNTLMER